MSHRTQVILTDDQYSRLKRESDRTGVTLGELIRRAVDRAQPTSDRDSGIRGLEESFGAWRERGADGESYVDDLRRGLARRLTR